MEIWKTKHHGGKWENSVPMLKHERLQFSQRKKLHKYHSFVDSTQALLSFIWQTQAICQISLGQWAKTQNLKLEGHFCFHQHISLLLHTDTRSLTPPSPLGRSLILAEWYHPQHMGRVEATVKSATPVHASLTIPNQREPHIYTALGLPTLRSSCRLWTRACPEGSHSPCQLQSKKITEGFQQWARSLPHKRPVLSHDSS